MNVHSAPPHGDIATYAQRLRGSMEDKLFFLSRVPQDVTVFADFGCADGSLLWGVAKERYFEPGGHELTCIGYDIDHQMVQLARQSDKFRAGGFEFTSAPAMFRARIERQHRMGKKSCLVLSSVVHEVVSQGTSWRTFWSYVQSLGCHYVAIRDMAVTRNAKYEHGYPPEWLAAARLHDPLFPCLGTADILQVLLKARYPENAEREAAEDYFAVTAEQFLNWTTIGSGYRLRHFDHAPLPYLVEDWKRRYGLTITEPTHVKLLLQRST